MVSYEMYQADNGEETISHTGSNAGEGDGGNNGGETHLEEYYIQPEKECRLIGEQ